MSTRLINQELIGYFIKHLNDLGLKSYSTIKNLERDLKKFLDFAEEAEISSDLIKDYIEHIEDKYLESSFLSKLSSIRQFVEWLNLKDNPFWSTSINIKSKFDNFYDYEDIFTKLDDEKQIDKLLVFFIYEFYLSVDELTALNIGDYNLAQGGLSVRDSLLEASGSLKNLIKIYLNETRPKLSDESVGIDAPFFLNEKGERINVLDIRNRISDYELRPLYVKKSRVMHLLDEGMSFEQIETKLSTTLSKAYKPFLKTPDYRLLKAYKDFHPRAAK